jgi:hypothetical protein
MMMNNQEILDNVPKGEGGDVVDITGAYFDAHCNHLNSEGFWSEQDIGPVGPRRVADIKRIVELEKALDKLIDRAQQVDSWESFPDGWLDEAFEALKDKP